MLWRLYLKPALQKRNLSEMSHSLPFCSGKKVHDKSGCPGNKGGRSKGRSSVLAAPHCMTFQVTFEIYLTIKMDSAEISSVIA